MSSDAMKKRAAEAAIEYIQYNKIIGIGTGSTVNYFIDILVKIKPPIEGVISSSTATTDRLKAAGIKIFHPSSTEVLPIYIDSADETNYHLQLIKGGGGALTQEKILAATSELFICIVDYSKLVNTLGTFPLPIEIIPIARYHIEREIARLGGQAIIRKNFFTEHGNLILDVFNLQILEPKKMEDYLNNIAGVVTVGLFALRPADILIIGTDHGVKTILQQEDGRLYKTPA